jgi:hypothetical protein
MTRILLPVLIVLFLPVDASGQGTVKGPYQVSDDSIEVTITEVKLTVATSRLEFGDTSTPNLRPTGSTEAQIWFALGFLLDSCRVKKFQRVDSDSIEKGATVHNATFRCHYKASEFRSAVRDLVE